MGTTRTPIDRAPIRKVTAEARSLFAKAMALQEVRYACLASDEQCQHPECDAYRELFLALHRELGLTPWDESPLDAEDTDPIRAELQRTQT